MRFEYYVLNYNWNRQKMEHFNIFDNCNVQERTEKAIKKYLKAPSKYKYVEQYSNSFLNVEEIVIYGFNALCAEIDSIIKWQEWGRREYEISVSDAFVYEISDIVKDLDKFETIEELKEELIKQNKRNPKLEKWDCYNQCEKNIIAITNEAIRQYKEQLKNNNKGENNE